ncbi:unnamed protein product [Orchesella dallaii]|uniref:Uncharacterized protein n=1 Tax=Orchesella dallaii TaxID=48710 RepID=A0ABP1QC68_9HEXA
MYITSLKPFGSTIRQNDLKYRKKRSTSNASTDNIIFKRVLGTKKCASKDGIFDTIVPSLKPTPIGQLSEVHDTNTFTKVAAANESEYEDESKMLEIKRKELNCRLAEAQSQQQKISELTRQANEEQVRKSREHLINIFHVVNQFNTLQNTKFNEWIEQPD